MSRETKPLKEPRTRIHDTFVFPDECVCSECRSLITHPMVITRDPPDPMYLRFQAVDYPPKGFSNLTEVDEVARQIHQDVVLDVIPISYGVQRLQAVWMQVVQHGKSDLAFPSGKALARDLLDLWLTKIRQKTV